MSEHSTAMRHSSWVFRTALSALLFVAGAVQAQQTTVILVRHAEKAAEPANDPPLTEVGEARARALWNAVKDAGVDAIITTQFARTKATAAPTAMATGITPEVVQASANPNSANAAADAVRKHAGHTVLVVGHSNTIPLIIAALGIKQPISICDASYDNLYVVTLRDGKAGLVQAKFGERTPEDQGCLGMTIKKP
jgi:broad specificity phosphatase PhoE